MEQEMKQGSYGESKVNSGNIDKSTERKIKKVYYRYAESTIREQAKELRDMSINEILALIEKRLSEWDGIDTSFKSGYDFLHMSIVEETINRTLKFFVDETHLEFAQVVEWVFSNTRFLSVATNDNAVIRTTDVLWNIAHNAIDRKCRAFAQSVES